LFDSFENISYKQFKQFNSYMGRVSSWLSIKLWYIDFSW
jgi:hypothetical protein